MTTRYHTHALQVAPFENLVFRWTLLSSGLTRLLGGISGMNWPILLVDMENSDALTIISTLHQIGQLYLLKSTEKEFKKTGHGWMTGFLSAFHIVISLHLRGFEADRTNQRPGCLGCSMSPRGVLKQGPSSADLAPNPAATQLFVFSA